jgi:CheY-like chemotaxis protein
LNCCRVLIIEDELLVGLDLVSTLETAGFAHVEHAMGEPEALSRLRSEPWDLVVADANLNGTGIHQIAKLLRQLRLPFLVVTGYGRESLPVEIGEAPVLPKPIAPREFIRHVQELCSAVPQLVSSPVAS